MKSAHSKARPVLWISVAACLLSVVVAIIWFATSPPLEVRVETPVDAPIEAAAPGIPRAKEPSFGKPAKVPKTEIAMATIGKFAHHYIPSPPLEVERKQAEAAIQPADDTVKIVTGFECSTPLEIEKFSPTHFAITITTGTEFKNWFMFKVEGVKGKTIRIDIREAPLKKWWSLNPVYSYLSSIDELDALTVRTVANPAEPIKAHNGPLLPDTSGQKWQFMPNVWSEQMRWEVGSGKMKTVVGQLCMVQKFVEDSVYVALKVPYTPSMNEQVMKSFEAKPQVSVIEVGRSRQGRPLQVLEFPVQATDPTVRFPTALVYAREHGNEQDVSWVATGIAEFLSSDQPEAVDLRRKLNFLIIPLLDPDGAVAGRYTGIGDRFEHTGAEGREARAYAQFFKKWIDSGRRLDLVVNLHNVESAESSHLACPMLSNRFDQGELGMKVYQRVAGHFERAGFLVNSKPLGRGDSNGRLGGYLEKSYGCLHLPLEVNSQEQRRHLASGEMKQIGQVLAVSLSDELFERGASLEARTNSVLGTRKTWIERHGSEFNPENAIEFEQACWSAFRSETRNQ